MDSCPQWHEAGMDAETTRERHSLAHLHKGARGRVVAVESAGVGGLSLGDDAGSTIARRLLEVGFVPGERIEVVEEIRPGGDPIAVRIGSSIFALRRREAHAVLVELEFAEPFEALEGP
ncbi:MAG: FeoA family protein [Steroidobacteraceae bacterium]|jgi:ferrous iron transport protein A